MINLKAGCRVPFSEKLFEQYEKIEQGYIANINVEKILDLVKDFIIMQEQEVFFFLEVPTNRYDEKENESGIVKKFHKDVYYMDYMDKEKVFGFLDVAGELLVNDGLASFGFGTQENNDEIVVGKYNVVKIYSCGNSAYDVLFEKNGIAKTTKLVTAWDTFTKDAPGHSEHVSLNGKNVYSIIEDFKESGLYFAERIEDN